MMPPPRLCVRPSAFRSRHVHQHLVSMQIDQRRHASSIPSAAITPAPAMLDPSMFSTTTLHTHPPMQPPSYKRPEFRKTQLLRQYASLIQSCPLILILQHNNLFSSEWMAIRRELSKALRKVDSDLAQNSSIDAGLADEVKIQVIQGGVFKAALNIVEFFHPPRSSSPPSASSSDASTRQKQQQEVGETHILSPTAYQTARRALSGSKRNRHGLEPLLSGPLALVTFPSVSPAHLAAALRILSPDTHAGGLFEAPKRRANPSYYDAAVQNALQKMILLGARVEGRVFGDAQVRWAGGLQGGLDGLRAQLVTLLQRAGGGSVADLLDGVGKAVYFTLEGRKMMLEEDGSPEAEVKG